METVSIYPVLLATPPTAKFEIDFGSHVHRTTVAELVKLLLDGEASLTQGDRQLIVRLAEVCWQRLKEENR